jgi:hypothetical protein
MPEGQLIFILSLISALFISGVDWVEGDYRGREIRIHKDKREGE